MTGQQPEVRQGFERARRRRGNMILESAFVFVPLMAIIFAIIDFGMAIFLRSTFQHAVREGVRYGVTYRTQSGMGHDDSIKAVVQHNAMGFLASAENRERIKIRYYVPDTLVETNQNLPGNLLEVSIENYPWGWMAPLMRGGQPLLLNAYASDRMEGIPAGMTLPPR